VHQILHERLGLFATFRGVLADTHTPPTVNEKLAIAEVLSENVNHIPMQLRAYVTELKVHPEKPEEFPAIANGVVGKLPTASATEAGSKGRTLMYLILHLFENTEDTGVLFHVSEMIRKLIDPDFQMEVADRDAYLGCFYDYYYPWLLNPLQKKAWEQDTPTATATATEMAVESQSSDTQSLDPEELPVSSETTTTTADAVTASVTQYPTCHARNHVCELLTYCVRCHNYRIKYFLLRCNMVERILALLEYKEKYLQLSAIRFIRACIGHKVAPVCVYIYIYICVI
jgi:hypothetical protein